MPLCLCGSVTAQIHSHDSTQSDSFGGCNAGARGAERRGTLPRRAAQPCRGVSGAQGNGSARAHQYPYSLHPDPSRAGTVEAVGDGRVGERTQEFQLKAGDTIVYSKFGIGATDLEVQGETYVLIKEDDCIGTLPRPGATAADVPELKPIGDRVLLKVGVPAWSPACRACIYGVSSEAQCLGRTPLPLAR